MNGPGEENAGAKPEEREGLARLGFVSEEGDVEGSVSSQKDFWTSLIIAVVALIATVMGLTMENPGRSFLTSPGLLPFLTGITLFAMSLGLMLTALRRSRGAGLFSNIGEGVQDYFQNEENRMALFLIAVLFAYVVLIDFISFDPTLLRMGDFYVRFSSFEAVTIVVLTYILRVFWKKPVRQCLLVSFLTSSGLAFAFRYGFQLLMPGVQ